MYSGVHGAETLFQKCRWSSILPHVPILTFRKAPLADNGVITLVETERLLRRIFRREDKCSPPTFVLSLSEFPPRVLRCCNFHDSTYDPETTRSILWQFCNVGVTSVSASNFLTSPPRTILSPSPQHINPSQRTCRDDHGGHCGDAYHRITPRVRFSRRATSRGRHDSARISFFSSRFHHLASPQPVPKSPAGQY